MRVAVCVAMSEMIPRSKRMGCRSHAGSACRLKKAREVLLELARERAAEQRQARGKRVRKTIRITI